MTENKNFRAAHVWGGTTLYIAVIDDENSRAACFSPTLWELEVIQGCADDWNENPERAEVWYWEPLERFTETTKELEQNA